MEALMFRKRDSNGLNRHGWISRTLRISKFGLTFSHRMRCLPTRLCTAVQVLDSSLLSLGELWLDESI